MTQQIILRENHQCGCSGYKVTWRESISELMREGKND